MERMLALASEQLDASLAFVLLCELRLFTYPLWSLSFHQSNEAINTLPMKLLQ